MGSHFLLQGIFLGIETRSPALIFIKANLIEKGKKNIIKEI